MKQWDSDWNVVRQEYRFNNWEKFGNWEKYDVAVCRMTVKEYTAQWPSFTVLHMKGSPESLQIVTHLKPKSIYTTYRIMNEKCRLETAKSKVKLESVVIDCSEQHSWENVLLCACIIYI